MEERVQAPEQGEEQTELLSEANSQEDILSESEIADLISNQMIREVCVQMADSAGETNTETQSQVVTTPSASVQSEDVSQYPFTTHPCRCQKGGCLGNGGRCGCFLRRERCSASCGCKGNCNFIQNVRNSILSSQSLEERYNFQVTPDNANPQPVPDTPPFTGPTPGPSAAIKTKYENKKMSPLDALEEVMPRSIEERIARGQDQRRIDRCADRAAAANTPPPAADAPRKRGRPPKEFNGRVRGAVLKRNRDKYVHRYQKPWSFEAWRVFFAILLIMGLNQQPTLPDYWSNPADPDNWRKQLYPSEDDTGSVFRDVSLLKLD